MTSHDLTFTASLPRKSSERRLGLSSGCREVGNLSITDDRRAMTRRHTARSSGQSVTHCPPGVAVLSLAINNPCTQDKDVQSSAHYRVLTHLITPSTRRWCDVWGERADDPLDPGRGLEKRREQKLGYCALRLISVWLTFFVSLIS